jgi:carbonic anhydrase/acetyltransferase-like protein (isoleucine patch superfamily)
MAIYALGNLIPRIDPSAFVHPDAVIIGDVTVGAESSIWPTAVLRGDHAPIVIGAQTSIQDGTVIHVSRGIPTTVGNRCVVGHNAHLEGCTIHDHCLVGSGSVVLHKVEAGPHSLIGACAMVPNNKIIPPHAKALGVPVTITENAIGPDDFEHAVDSYVRNVHQYAAELRRLD